MKGYKAAKHGNIRVCITLEIPTTALVNINRDNIFNRNTAKYRTNKAKVLRIEDVKGNTYTNATTAFYNRKSLEYKVGEMIEEPMFDKNLDNVCAEGIHFFIDKTIAEGFNKAGIIDGIDIQYHPNGQKLYESTYTNGRLNGLCQYWYENGRKQCEVTFIDGKQHGTRLTWYECGQKHTETAFIEGKLHGICRHWYRNGQLLYEANFMNGKQHGLSQSWYEDGQKQAESIFKNGEIIPS